MNAAEAKSLLASLSADRVKSVYSGKDGKCCCGCSGNHRYASAHKAVAEKDRGYPISKEEVNDRQVKRVLGIVQANFTADDAANPGEQTYYHADHPGGVTHFSAAVGERLYVVYLLPNTA